MPRYRASYVFYDTFKRRNDSKEFDSSDDVTAWRHAEAELQKIGITKFSLEEIRRVQDPKGENVTGADNQQGRSERKPTTYVLTYGEVNVYEVILDKTERNFTAFSDDEAIEMVDKSWDAIWNNRSDLNFVSLERVEGKQRIPLGWRPPPERDGDDSF